MASGNESPRVSQRGTAVRIVDPRGGGDQQRYYLEPRTNGLILSFVWPTSSIHPFAILGDKVYPDANFSLRISYGRIQGWTYRGVEVPHATNFAGLYERATGAEPFKLAPRWEQARDRLDLSTAFDVVSTNDIIGGNSGSPLINARAEVIGAVFDGNIHSLGGAYGYDGALNRTISVSTAVVTEALSTVYGRTALVAELARR